MELNGTSTERLDKVLASVIFLSLKPREKYQKLKYMKNMATVLKHICDTNLN